MNPVVITILAFAVPLLVVLWFTMKWFKGLNRSSSRAGNRSKWGILSIVMIVLATVFGGWVWLCLTGLVVSFVWMHFQPNQKWFGWATFTCGILLFGSVFFNQSAKTRAAKETRIAAASSEYRKSELIARTKARGMHVNPDASFWEGHFLPKDDEAVSKWKANFAEIINWTNNELTLKMNHREGTLVVQCNRDAKQEMSGSWILIRETTKIAGGDVGLNEAFGKPADGKRFGGWIKGLPSNGETPFGRILFTFIPRGTSTDAVRRFVE